MEMSTEPVTAPTSHQPPEDTIATEGPVYLCPFHASDAEALARIAGTLVLANDPPVSNNPPIAIDYTIFPGRHTLGDSTEWLGMLERGEVPETFAIRSVSDGALAGGISLTPCQGVEYRTGTLAYWVTQEFWSTDTIFAAVTSFTKWCFETKDKLRRIEADAYERNTRSQRGLIRYGFRKDGVRRHAVEIQGYVMNLHMFGLLKAEALGLNPDDFITKFPGPRNHPSSEQWNDWQWPDEVRKRFKPPLSDEEG